MKKKITYTVLSVCLFLFASCNLDVQPDNRSELNSAITIQKLLVSAYPTVSTWMLTEMMSDNTDDNGGLWNTHSLLQSQAYRWEDITDRQNDDVFYIWEKHYKAVAIANAALHAIEELEKEPGVNLKELEPLRGEALLCRAYGHFVLVNIFCQHYNPKTSSKDLGITYITEPETELIVKHERGNVAHVYEMIEKDLLEGLPLISDDIHDQPKYHFNKGSSYAFATRFYLYYRDAEGKNLDNVIKYATLTLGNKPTTMLRDWKALASLNPFNITLRPNAFISVDSRANLLLIPVTSIWGRIHGPYKTGSRYTHNEIISRSETVYVAGTPWGNNVHLNPTTQTSIMKVITRKYAEYFEYTDPLNAVGYPHIVQSIFTTDEVLLSRAEAYILKNDPLHLDLAYQDLTMFTNNYTRPQDIAKERILKYYRDLAFYDPLKPTPKKELNIDFVLDEERELLIHYTLHLRRMLNIHEGLRWHDVKRYGIEIYRRTIYGGVTNITDKLVVNDPRRAVQLPPQVIGAGLAPNPR